MLSSIANATSCELRFAAALALVLGGCGPHHHGGGSSGSSGSSSEAGAGGDGASGGSSAGSGGISTSGAGGGGTGGGSGTAGSAGGAVTFPDAVIGCQPATWPAAGYFVLAPLADELATPEELLLARMTASGLSADGTLVVGSTSDPPTRSLAVAWEPSAGAAGIRQLPPVILNPDLIGLESIAIQASCDGSIILQKDIAFGEVYRTEGDQAPVVLIGSPSVGFVHMNPDGSTIVNGRGIETEFGAKPQRWTAATGTVELASLQNEVIYGVHPDGTLIAGNADELYEYDVGADTKTPIGMAVADFVPWWEPSLKVAASGEAWVQSADANHDSFLVWRPPAEPRSVTCAGRCEVIDLSGTAKVVLLEARTGSSFRSVLWTQPTGFIDLTTVVQQMGVDLGTRELHAVALSDDGRVVTGYAQDPSVTYYSSTLFYAVLPASIYE